MRARAAAKTEAAAKAQMFRWFQKVAKARAVAARARAVAARAAAKTEAARARAVVARAKAAAKTEAAAVAAWSRVPAADTAVAEGSGVAEATAEQSQASQASQCKPI